MKPKLKIHGKCAITQFDHETYSHADAWAYDIESRENDKNLGYSVNVPVVCKAVDKQWAFTWWQTKDKVELPNGDTDYLVFMFGHDNDINAYVGMNINANVRLGNMGTGGIAQGAHVHIEIGKGAYKGKWYKNDKSVYMLYNSQAIYDLIFMDDLDLQDYTDPTDYRQDLLDEAKTHFRYTTDVDTPTEEENTNEGNDDGVNGIIDVSSWQPTIDYAKVAKNTKGAILRCGRTGYGTAKSKEKDSCFEKHYAGFKKAGVPVGVYYYSCATSIEEAKEEAKLVLEILKGKKLEYPVYFDTEDNHDIKGAGCSPVSQYSIGKAKLTEVAKAFLETIEKAGYYVGIYASKSWLENQLDMSQLKDYDVWLAQYASKPTYKGAYGMWQYSSTGKIDGISGNVDMNWCYKDYPSIIKKAGLNGYSSTVEKPTGDETENLEQELAETKKALETAQKELETQKAEVIRLKKKVNDARAILNAS